MYKKIDKVNRFVSIFNPDTGFYVRSGVIDSDGKDTGVDPFMSSFPEVLDIGIMEKCVCASKCNVDCYQKAINRTGNNMSLENYKKLIEQCKGKLYQVALGGAGDVDTHEDFESIVRTTRECNIVPNFTTSGISMTKEKAEICKRYCGAVAVSEHFAEYTNNAIDMLLNAGVKTNIHYVLGKKTIDEAINRLQNNSFKEGINAVVFLLYKPIGLGKQENVLSPNDDKVKTFFELIDKGNFHHKVGFDRCSCAGLINYTKGINLESVDYCEGGRFSAYIDANMNMMPCSFGNQDSRYFVNLKDNTIEQAWNSDVFNRFRYSLIHSCPNCEKRDCCRGGCPIVNEITLCSRKEREFIRGN